MGKRYIDCSARELAAYHKKELLQSIADSEGRVLAAETIGTVTPMLVNITNAEFVTSLGADIIMLNIFDVDHPVINGLPEVAPEDTIHEVKRLTGRMVAINLEPAAVRNDGEKSVWSLTEGRRATVENAKKAADMGVDMIVLTGNPGVGVDNRAITKALADLNEAVGDRVILTAGKMHASGILSEAGEKILTKEDAETFIEAGADVLLLPAPGTVPHSLYISPSGMTCKNHSIKQFAFPTQQPGILLRSTGPFFNHFHIFQRSMTFKKTV